MPRRFSPAADRFLRDEISSMVQLDALLVLHANDARWWTPAGMAAELRTSEAAAGAALETLGRCNLVDVRVGGSLSYRFAPVDIGLSRIADEIVDANYHARDEVVARVTARGRSADAARRIADAFRLRHRSGDA